MLRILPVVLFASLFGLGTPSPSRAATDASAPLADPVLEPPTLHCLAIHWIIRGDENRNATVAVHYRRALAKSARADAAAWRQGPSLFRVDKGANRNDKGQSSVDVPDDAWLFAGSVLFLDEDTDYELKLTLADPDGGSVEKRLRCRTLAEPVAAPDAPRWHVIPANATHASNAGGGDGSAAKPFKGLEAAQKAARPGDVLLLHAGVYEGSFTVRKSGEPGKPIVYRAAGDGEAALDAGQSRQKLSGAVVEARGVHDVWFEGLTLRNAYNAVRAHESARLVIRRCSIHDCLCGIVADIDDKRTTTGFFIADNTIEGFMPWPTTPQQWHDLPESRGIWLAGTGHVVCYNRIRHMKDGMDTAESVPCYAVDFHNNDISEMFDDGCEMDGSERNTRNYHNRYSNTLTGVSLQPVYGGPVYVFRNVIYNFQTEAFKLHNNPSGGILFHNTALKHGGPLLGVSTPDSIRHCTLRNNLFVGTEGRAVNFEGPTVDCDFDYDGFAGFSVGGDPAQEPFMKWNQVKYATPAQTRAKAPIYKHVIALDPANLFVSGTAPADGKKAYDASTLDLRLKPHSPAVDAGEALPGLNDGFTGSAPDLGAYEVDTPMPHYGPREEKVAK